jgi:hypothetical protein
MRHRTVKDYDRWLAGKDWPGFNPLARQGA